jgi:hypothetical protein
MNKMAHALVDDSRFAQQGAALVKVALDQHLRNIAAEVLRTGGDALGKFRNNPITSSAVSGALLGGGVNALRAQEGESKLDRFGRGALGGAVAGAATGLAAGGAMRNLGRFGEEISYQVGRVRGPQNSPIDVASGGMQHVLRNAFSPTARRGVFGSARQQPGLSQTLKDDWNTVRELQRRVKDQSLSEAERVIAAQNLKKAKSNLSLSAGGPMGHLTGPEGAALLATGAIGSGAAADHVMNKESNLKTRLYRALETAGGVVQHTSPAALGALGGATIGATAAGEGNRLVGAASGGIAGAGLNVAAAKGLLGERVQGYSNALTRSVRSRARSLKDNMEVRLEVERRNAEMARRGGTT